MEKSCSTCIFQIWAVGVGQAIFCLCEENEGKDLGFGINKQGRPLLPVQSFYNEGVFGCEHWIEEKDG